MAEYTLSELFSVYLKTIKHLNLKLLIFIGTLQVFRISKVEDFNPLPYRDAF